jgi:hypothetical protein
MLLSVETVLPPTELLPTTQLLLLTEILLPDTLQLERLVPARMPPPVVVLVSLLVLMLVTLLVVLPMLRLETQKLKSELGVTLRKAIVTKNGKS